MKLKKIKRLRNNILFLSENQRRNQINKVVVVVLIKLRIWVIIKSEKNKKKASSNHKTKNPET
jgi:flagellar biosynthesis regulator FlaF